MQSFPRAQADARDLGVRPSPAADSAALMRSAMTDDLNGLADWLPECGVDVVALESTGVNWIPVYEVLEQRG